jgi:hypothetical protein
MVGVQSNYCINATVRLVTPLAVASVAPSRPARYAVRWTFSDPDCSDFQFGRIFSGT